MRYLAAACAGVIVTAAGLYASLVWKLHKVWK